MGLSLVTVPDPVLRQISQPITKIDKKTSQFINNLGQVLTHKKDPPGVGISAIQVGKPLRLIMTYLPNNYSGKRKDWDKDNLQLTAHINPTITKHSKKITLGENPKKPTLEGCLSIPHIYGPIWRYEWIEMEYYSLPHQLPPLNKATGTSDVWGSGGVDILNLDRKLQRFSGFVARVIQHEYDHLDGILFTDYVLGKSPAKSFNPLGDISDIYFEQDNEMIPVKDPTKLITW